MKYDEINLINNLYNIVFPINKLKIMNKINNKSKSNVGHKQPVMNGVNTGEVNLSLPSNNKFFQRRQE